MKHKKTKLCMVVMLAIGLTGAGAQESVSAVGGEALGSGGSASYTVGQLADETHTSAAGSVSEGVQQPFEISVHTAIKEVKGIALHMMTYPNPVTGFLTLSVKDMEVENMAFQLCNMQGKVLKSGLMKGQLTNIDLTQLANSTYLLKVYQVAKEATIDDASIREIKVFKIIKH